MNQVDETAIYALTPIVVLLASRGGTREGGESAMGSHLFWCVMGVAGVLLALPVTSPLLLLDSSGLWAAVPSMVCAGVASVWLHHLLQRTELMRAAAVLLLLQAVVLTGLYIMLCGTESMKEVLKSFPPLTLWISLGQFALLIWLVRNLAPSRLSSRFLLVPLATIAEGILILRPELTLRFTIGGGLLAAGALGVVVGRDEPESLTVKLS